MLCPDGLLPDIIQLSWIYERFRSLVLNTWPWRHKTLLSAWSTKIVPETWNPAIWLVDFRVWVQKSCSNVLWPWGLFAQGATCGAGSVYPFGAPEITSSFWWGSCYLFFLFLCCVSVLLFVCLSFSFWAMALSVYFRPLSLNFPLVSFFSLLIIFQSKSIRHLPWIMTPFRD